VGKGCKENEMTGRISEGQAHLIAENVAKGKNKV
jgi:hypothetical protein